MTLAFVAGRQGRPRQAIREIEAALTGLHGVDRARAQAQRGAILSQSGDLDAALASYEAALPTLREAGDQVWVMKILTNRGVADAQRNNLGAAVVDLNKAARLSMELGASVSFAFIEQNLAWVHTLRGDVPHALTYLDRAERDLTVAGVPLGDLLYERSELLLSVWLASEARASADAAVRALEEHALRPPVLPEARLLLARTALLEGEPAFAEHQARRAVRELSRKDRPAQLALARFVALTAELAGEHRKRVTPSRVQRAADALEATGSATTATAARLIAGELALERGRTDAAIAQFRLAGEARRRGLAAQRARGWYATALLRLALGETGTGSAVRAGLRILDEHSAALGTGDVEWSTAGGRDDLARLGLRLAVRRQDPKRALEWAERAQAGLFLFPPVLPPEDPQLASYLSELRAATAHAADMRRAGRGNARMITRQIQLERQIRDHCRRQPGSDQPVSIDVLVDRLGGATLVEFAEADGDLYAVSVAAGRVRLHRFGPTAPVHALVHQMAGDLTRLTWPRAPHAGRTVEMFRRTAANLDTALLGPLMDGVSDAPLVVVPSATLRSVPWSVLPSCHGRPVTVAPSATSWCLARDRPNRPRGKVAVVAGPALANAAAEAQAIAGIYASTALIGDSATVDRVMAELDGADLAHLATVGHLSAESPLFSALHLADGPLPIYDLGRLARIPSTVVLAGELGPTGSSTADGLLRLAAVLQAWGALELVAPLIPAPDADRTAIMVEFHRRLAAGHTPAEALADAQLAVAGDDAPTIAAAGALVCIGLGHGTAT